MSVRHAAFACYDLVRIFAYRSLLSVQRDARKLISALQLDCRYLLGNVCLCGIGSIVLALRLTIVYVALIVYRDRQRRLRDLQCAEHDRRREVRSGYMHCVSDRTVREVNDTHRIILVNHRIRQPCPRVLDRQLIKELFADSILRLDSAVQRCPVIHFLKFQRLDKVRNGRLRNDQFALRRRAQCVLARYVVAFTVHYLEGRSVICAVVVRVGVFTFRRRVGDRCRMAFRNSFKRYFRVAVLRLSVVRYRLVFDFRRDFYNTQFPNRIQGHDSAVLRFDQLGQILDNLLVIIFRACCVRVCAPAEELITLKGVSVLRECFFFIIFIYFVRHCGTRTVVGVKLNRIGVDLPCRVKRVGEILIVCKEGRPCLAENVVLGISRGLLRLGPADECVSFERARSRCCSRFEALVDLYAANGNCAAAAAVRIECDRGLAEDRHVN